MDRNQYVANVKNLVGTPYLWDGMLPTGTDCSGTVCQAMEWTEKKNAQEIYDMFKAHRVERLQAQPGALYFYGDGPGAIHHVVSVIARWPNGSIVIVGARGGDSTTIDIDAATRARAYVCTEFGDYWLSKFVGAVDPFAI